MTRIKLFALLFAMCTLAFSSCGEKIDNEGQKDEPIFSVQDLNGKELNSISVAADATEASFNIVSNIAWTVTSDSDWVSVTPATFGGSDQESTTKVTLSIKANTAEASRSAKLTIGHQDVSVTVLITQEGTKNQSNFTYCMATFNNEGDEWTIVLLDNALVSSELENGTGLTLSIKVDPNATFEEGLPTGNFLQGNEEVGTFSFAAIVDFANGEMVDITFMTEGMVTIEKVKDNYRITLALSNEDGEELNVVYEGEVLLEEGEDEDEDEGGAVFEEDTELTMTIGVATYYAADEYGPASWEIAMLDELMLASDFSGGYLIGISIPTESTYKDGLPYGTLVINKECEVFIFSAKDSENYDLTSGTVTIGTSDAGHTITIKGVCGANVTVSYTGILSIEEYS